MCSSMQQHLFKRLHKAKFQNLHVRKICVSHKIMSNVQVVKNELGIKRSSNCTYLSLKRIGFPKYSEKGSYTLKSTQLNGQSKKISCLSFANGKLHNYCFLRDAFIMQKHFYATFKKGKDNLTAVLYGKNDLRLVQRPIPKPLDNQVVLAMQVIGICGSDVHYLVNGRIGPFVIKKPMVLGHEGSGIVVDIGKKVNTLQIGDRVAIEPGEGCRTCNYCKMGRYNLCPNMAFCATPPIDGNLTRYYAHSADLCFKLPSKVSLEEGALLEPLACGVRACKRANITVGSNVLILGAGPIGLVTLMAAKAFGASKVVIADSIDYRLQLALEIGADGIILVNRNDKEQDLMKRIRRTLGTDRDSEPNVSIDCCGAEMALRIAVQVTQTGGTVVLLGMSKTELMFPLTNVIFREVDIKGVFRYVNDYPTALELVSNGKVDVQVLITHEYRLEDALEAFHTAKIGKDDAIKVLIHANSCWESR